MSDIDTASPDPQWTKLVAASEKLATSRSMDAIVSVLRETAREIVDADGISVVIRDGDQCHYVAEDAMAPLWAGNRFPLTSCVSGWAMAHRETVAIADIHCDERIPQEAYRPTFVRSLVMAPIGAPDAIAALGAYWSDVRRHSDDVIKRIEALARSAAIAVENVKLLKSLQESDRQRTIALSAGRMGVWTLDIASGQLTTSDMCRSNFGRDPAEAFSYADLHDAIHPDDKDRINGAIDRSIRTKADYDVEYRILTPSGDIRWVGIRAQPFYDEHGKPVSLSGVSVDVTGRKYMEQQQRDSEARQAFLLRLEDALRPLEDAASVQSAAAAVLGEQLDADRVEYGDVGPDGHVAVADGASSRLGRFPLDDFGSARVAELRAGRTLIINDGSTGGEQFAQATSPAAVRVIAPLVRSGRLVALLMVDRLVPRVWQNAELALIEATGERTWEAIERARAEAALRASQARYRMLFEAIDAGFCIFEVEFDALNRATDYRTIEVNPAFEKQTGMVNVVGRLARERLPGIEQKWVDLYGRVALTGEPVRYEDRSEPLGKWFEVNAFRIGAPTDRRIAVLFNDISERKATEEALRQSEDRFRNLADAMPQLVWSADANGQINYYNARRTRYDGISVQAENGWSWTALVHPDDLKRTLDTWAHAAATGEPYTCEHRLALKGKDWTWHVSRAECVRDASGTITKWYGTAINVADLKSAQEEAEALNRTLERRIDEALAERKFLADIVEGTDAFVQVADLDFRWLAINRAAATEFEHMFKVRPKVGDNMLDLLADRPEQQIAIKALWSRALAGEEFTEIGEFPDPIRGRRSHEMKFNILRDRDGRQIGGYQFAYDRTDRLHGQARLAEAEDQLRQSQKMDTIGQLTGGVAHDFNNLLTPIVGALDVLRRRLDGDARAQRLTDGALHAADRARTLVQRLLAFSRRQHLEPRAVDVRALIEGMADLVSRSLGPRIRLVLEIADDLASAQVDPNQLELALLNLSVNARDAMAGDGKLTISARGATVSNRSKLKSGNYVRVSVADTGIGMDKETLRRATEPFFTTKGVGRGTGLGLSSVQGLAEQSGGEFVLESRPGRGTIATLWLPVSETSPLAAVASPDNEITYARVDSTPIMLVDDEDLVRIGTADMLAEAGYQVTEAASAYQALQLMKSGVEIAVLVTDYAMPGMTGAELAREARALRPNLPVLMITGYAAVTDREAGGLPRLAKPFRQIDLAAAVADLLDNANVISLPRLSTSHSKG